MRLALISLLMIPLAVGCGPTCGEGTSLVEGECKADDDGAAELHIDGDDTGPSSTTTRLYECTDKNGQYETLFNCEEDTTLLYVGTEEVWTGEMCDGVDTVTLRSSSCGLPDGPDVTEIGQVIIDPCGGPVGTRHQIVVRVNATYQHLIEDVSVRISSDGLEKQDCIMTQDTADSGLFKLTLNSEETEDEVRTDIIQFMLWKSE